jgi:hypothetical protein
MTRRRATFGIEETNDAFRVTLPKPCLKYVDFFLSLDCVGILSSSGAYPNCKEITETIGVFEAARLRVGLAHPREDVLAVCVGDGVFPRTAAYVAYLSRWKAVSVDPLLRIEDPRLQAFAQRTSRLHMHAQRIEDVRIDARGFTDVVFLFVHSHASLAAAVSALDGLAHDARIHAVSMPCCFGDDLGLAPTESYDDPNVLSVRRTLQVYRDMAVSLEKARLATGISLNETPLRGRRPGAR